MSKQSLCNLFIVFLKANDIYDLYLKYFANDYDNYSLQMFLIEHEPQSWLSLAFVWHHTSEGYDFWANISVTWHKKSKVFKCR